MSEAFAAHAVVEGASEGLGAAFAHAIAARGVGLVLIARRKDALESVANEVAEKHGVDVRTCPCDLADASFTTALAEITRDVTVGLGVCHAAYSFIAPLLERPIEDALRVDVNCRGPLRFVHTLAPAMAERGRGGIALMSSLAGFQGGPRLAT